MLRGDEGGAERAAGPRLPLRVRWAPAGFTQVALLLRMKLQGSTQVALPFSWWVRIVVRWRVPPVFKALVRLSAAATQVGDRA